MRRDIAVETVLPHPIDAVWQALTDPAELAEWVMPVEGFAAVAGQRFRFLAKPMPGWDGVINCEVLAVDAPHRLVIRWQGSRMRTPTTLTWTLTATDGGTRFRIDHAGFDGPTGVISALMHRSGWQRMARRRLGGHLGSRPAAR
ncbi:SRPBCC domain-containing protein [Dactylosporangium sp. NPDC051541]|uniref:SRPBCC domain-containing protein n=1 Tax=Dactylosporangium sp. NPDC051541 TaxID=3363977 RepID=UPI0037A489D7